MRDLRRRLGAFALLVGFLVQAGDGVAATLCHSGMDHGAEASHAHGGGGGTDPIGHDHWSPSVPDAPVAPHASDDDSGDEPCPFGSGAVLVCAGMGSALAPAGPVRAPVFPLLSVTAPPAVDSSGALLAHETFRPPRA